MRDASVSRLGRTGQTRPADPPWFVPYGLAVGVGHRRTASPRSSRRFRPSGVEPVGEISGPLIRPPFGTVGVGHCFALSVSVVPECRPLSVEYAAAPDAFESIAVAVGQHEESLTPVRRSGVGRSKQTPLRMEPEAGKVRENDVESQSKVSCDILKENEGRVGLFDDSRDVRPQVALVLDAESLARDRERLAGVACSDEIHSAAPRSSVERSKVRPDRSAIHRRVFHPGHENGRSEGFPLDVANTPRPSGQPEVDASDPGAERNGT